MREFAETLMYLLFAIATICVLLFLAEICEIWFAIVSFFLGAFFGTMSGLMKNQERIISLLEANPNEDEKEENRAE